MRHTSKADLLEAMKESLQGLENLKLLSPNDLEILDLRRSLKDEISALERQQSQAQAGDTAQGSHYNKAA